MKKTSRILSALLVLALMFSMTATVFADEGPAKVTVSFQAGGGTGTMDAVEIDPGEYELPACTFTNAGYQFTGWDLGPVGTKITVSANTVLTATWKKLHTITFETNGGTAIAPIQVLDGSTAPDFGVTTRTDAAFAGWYLNSTLTLAWDPSAAFSGDATLYAKWNVNGPVPPVTPSGTGYLITFDPNGGYVYSPYLRTDASGRLSTLPYAFASNYAFAGWYTDPYAGTPVTTESVFLADTTLYAHWTAISIYEYYDGKYNAVTHGQVTADVSESYYGQYATLRVVPQTGYTLKSLSVADKWGTMVAVRDLGNGYYSFLLPSHGADVLVVFEPAGVSCKKDRTCVLTRFYDLSPLAWYHDGVHFCLENKLMAGESPVLFNPNGETTRAMVVTVLWRMAGCPVVNYAMRFKDVKSGDWYAEAIRWATAQGIVSGYSETEFGPNDPITREQAALILYRYAVSKNAGFTGSWMFLLSVADRTSISDWAYAAVCWATMNDVMEANAFNVFNPSGSVSRADLACLMMNLDELLK